MLSCSMRYFMERSSYRGAKVSNRVSAPGTIETSVSVMPAEAVIQAFGSTLWIPAVAGMTAKNRSGCGLWAPRALR